MVQTEQTNVGRLVELLDDRLKQSEWEILTTLAAADGPLSTEELVEKTGYTERTVTKRVGTLEEQVHSGTLLYRDDDDNPVLHPQFAQVVRDYVS